MPSRYKAMKIGGVKVDIHRHVVEKAIGRKLSRNEVVHHVNHDKHDNRIENLEIMSRAEHSRLHAPGVISVASRQKISASLKGNRNACRGNITDRIVREIRAKRAGGVGPTELARAYSIHKCTVIDIVKGRRYSSIL